MILTVIGCSGSIPGPTSPASCYLLEHDNFRLVIDMGHGALGALQQYIPLSSINAVAISHTHADHFVDLSALHVAHRYSPEEFPGPISLYGPYDLAERLSAAANTSTTALRTVFDYNSLAGTTQIGPFHVRAEQTAHPIETFALRVSVDDRVLGYTADSGPCSQLAEIGKDADVLLAEAAFRHRDENPTDLHLTGRDAGELAAQCNVGQLLLTHIPPWYDPESAGSEAAEVFKGRIELATPGLRVEIGR
jgi:ribonuclease BN (tRNA processing enzyme)